MKKILKSLTALILVLTVFLSVGALAPSALAADMSSTAGVVKLSSGWLNVRSTASASSSILATLSNGSYVTLLSKSGSWWKVEYAAGKYGYVYSSYVTQVSGSNAAKVSLASGTLNVRAGAGTSYSIVTQLYSGKIVVVLSSSNGWSRILYNGTRTGYVSSKYLSVSGATASSMTWPVPASGKIIQYFKSGVHLGIDIEPSVPGASGDTIVSAADGTVAYAGVLSGYGYVVYINSYVNGQYIQTRYGHLKSAPWVSAGAAVKAGQAIGAMGSSGNAEGPHLHFEVRVRNSSGACVPNSESTPVNPLNYVKY